jgi:hypothetical protein
MLPRVIRHIQTNKPRNLTILTLRQRKLRIHNLDLEFPRSAETLEDVGTLEGEVHAFAMAEVAEEGEKLDGFLLLDYLDAGFVCFPFFVDGDDHSAAGDGEGGGEAIQIVLLVSAWSTRVEKGKKLTHQTEP